MTHLVQLAENVWTVAAPLSLLGIHLGTRMTVVRLARGALWLHSPVSMSEELRKELDALGAVTHIVCPNLFHHLHAKAAKEFYPAAKLHAPHALRRKRKDLQIDADLSETPHPDWENDFQQIAIEGCMLHETVFFHLPSRTLITSDLVENFSGSDHWPTRVYLRLAGLQRRVTFNWPMRFLYRDRKLARACVDRILAWPFERVVIAHGDLIIYNARESVGRGLEWLK